MAPQIQDPLLPPGSLILVIAANGLIASHIVDQLLHYGYNVRGTVRDLTRCSWMLPLFQSRHPDVKFSLIEIPDIEAPGCYDDALRDVSAVIQTAAINIFTDDPTIISRSVTANLNILSSAAAANKSGAQIRRVVFTSSSWAVMFPTPNTPANLTTATYNTTAEIALRDPNTPKEARPVLTYVAAKTRAEQEAWAWARENRDAGFDVNTVLPATCIGPVLAPTDQQYPTTAGYVRSLYEGVNAEVFEWLDPQWYVDVRDAARLHVAAAVLEGVESERIFAWAEPYTWVGVAKVLEETMGRKVPIMLRDRGEDLTKPPMERSVGLLKRLQCEGYERFEVSVRENIRSYYPEGTS
ncbi:NAD(P)-binding protein [Lojkania enalia]|uniref:NAD(P)-binding protein n=1 Tax=Lojkania enalia TaxID=147567 RepID=A0A9P4K8F0_9PLEO|nr:NAD(P)-binding protein [Didymosphaeria enalia]